MKSATMMLWVELSFVLKMMLVVWKVEPNVSHSTGSDGQNVIEHVNAHVAWYQTCQHDEIWYENVF